MKLLFYIHGYPPSHNAGAEWMAYDVIEYLKQFHDINVLTRNAINGFQDGVTVKNIDVVTLKQDFNQADAVFTHLDFTGKAHNICRELGQHKLYTFVHNTSENALMRRRPNQFRLIYNSNYTAGLNYPQPFTICRPPIVPERYAKGKTGENAITLVNCWPDKGGLILPELAKLMPDRKFIGVLGGYGEQVKGFAPNLEYIDNSPNMADVYARTGILIQPSKYESYGKAACEAMSCGIPVVCTDTPGLREALDGAGIFVDRTAAAYKKAIEKIDIEKQQKKLAKRTAELVEQSKTDLETLNDFVQWKN
jgi:glycosyltransferase involved in cell wall biosynthesis